jgi:kinesin family protein 4/21/27
MQATEDIETLTSIEDELEALSAEINWVNDSIDKLQQDIMTFEDTKVETDTSEADSLIKKCSTREAKYLLEHLVNMAIESGFLAFQKDSEVKVLKLRLTTSENHMELMKMYSVSPHVPESPLVINNHSVCKINHQMFKYPQPNDADTNTTFILENEEGEESSKLDETFTKVHYMCNLIYIIIIHP